MKKKISDAELAEAVRLSAEIVGVSLKALELAEKNGPQKGDTPSREDVLVCENSRRLMALCEKYGCTIKELSDAIQVFMEKYGIK